MSYIWHSNRRYCPPLRASLWLGLLGGTLVTVWIGAQVQVSSVTPTMPASGESTSPAASLNPVEQFRLLMALPAAERDRSLADKPEEKRKLLENKIREYSALPSEERELRLRALQLRFYLEPLMRMPVTNRTARLASIPPMYRALVTDRLTEWDLIPPPLQKEVLETQSVRLYFVRLEGTTPAQRRTLWKLFPPERQKQLEEELSRWRAVPQEQRLRMYTLFDHFFELKEEEKERTLHILPAPERQQMEQALTTINGLPRAQRQQYLDSFRKFANLTPQQREQFFKSAERWRSMTTSERQTWRELVTVLPPLPPGMEVQPPLPPPPQ